MAAKLPGIVFGFAAQTEQVSGMTSEFFWDSFLGGVRWEHVEHALHLGHSADEAKVQPPLALQVLHALLEMAPVPGSVHDPHQRADDCADDCDSPENGIHWFPFQCRQAVTDCRHWKVAGLYRAPDRDDLSRAPCRSATQRKNAHTCRDLTR